MRGRHRLILQKKNNAILKGILIEIHINQILPGGGGGVHSARADFKEFNITFKRIDE